MNSQSYYIWFHRKCGLPWKHTGGTFNSGLEILEIFLECEIFKQKMKIYGWEKWNEMLI